MLSEGLYHRYSFGTLENKNILSFLSMPKTGHSDENQNLRVLADAELKLFSMNCSLFCHPETLLFGISEY
jgi:hypothetical protein